MDRPKPQLDPKVKAPFTETEVGVLLEHIDDKLAFIVESQQGLKEGQQGLDARIQRLDSRVEGLDTRLAVVETRLTRVERKVDVLTKTVGEIKVELTEVNVKLDRKVDRSEFKRLDRHVSVLEAAK